MLKKGRWKRTIGLSMMMLMLVGCSGFQRGCSSFNAQSFGSDWIVVQYDYKGDPFNCWKLKNASIANESNSDGIYWKDTTSGHLVHVSGWYNRVQVEGGRYDEAAKLIGVELSKITNGKYIK
jgi:hypothetical protein